MRPGRLPEDHPLEQRARDKLRAKPPIKQAKEQEQPKPAPAQPVKQPRWN